MQTFCSECGGTMQAGHMADRACYSMATQAFWVEGDSHSRTFALSHCG